MKTKNRILALLEISIVLCSVFLVALPAIAAEQTTQEISSAGVTTASKDDYVLGIYGNANEDDTIDMRDLTYVKLIFFGKKPETELADAKYDGKINPLDFIQIKLIIVGKEKEITIVDSADRIVTVKKPINRIIASQRGYDAEVLRTLREQDKIVGICNYVAKNEIYFPELSKLPSVGSWHMLDYEAIISLNPDLVIISTSKAVEKAEKLPGITVVAFSFISTSGYKIEVTKLGYILGRRDEAEEFIDYYDKYIDLIKARTEGLSEENRPKVYVEDWHDYKIHGGGDSVSQQVLDICGGRNIFADTEGYPDVDPEEVVMRNPDVIIRYTATAGYSGDDPSKAKALRDEIMSRPELTNVNAVKNKRVYITGYGMPRSTHVAYWAKWLHPELFEDLDPRAIYQEYLDRFQRIDFNVYEHGVFVYPEPS